MICLGFFDSDVTWTEFCHLLTPPPLHGQFLYTEREQKQTFFDPFPPHLVHIVIEWPLISFAVADIPMVTPAWGPRAVTSPTGDSILHIYWSKVFELKCDESSCFWETWPQRFTTDFGRKDWFQAMYIPKEMVTCI